MAQNPKKIIAILLLHLLLASLMGECNRLFCMEQRREIDRLTSIEKITDNDLIVVILGYLDIITMCKLELTSKLWHELVINYLSNKYIDRSRIDKITIKDPKFLKNLKKLIYNKHNMIVEFTETDLHNDKLRKLLNIKNLQKQLVGLHIHSCKLNTANLKEVAWRDFENLKFLTFTNCKLLNLIFLKEIFENNPSIEKLSIAQNRRTNGLPALLTVKSLNVSGCDFLLGSRKSKAAMKKMAQLEELDISSCSITDSWLKEIICYLTKLKTLKISGCRRITGDTLLTAIDLLPNLRIIDISFCKFSNATVKKLQEKNIKIIQKHITTKFQNKKTKQRIQTN